MPQEGFGFQVKAIVCLPSAVKRSPHKLSHPPFPFVGYSRGVRTGLRVGTFMLPSVLGPAAQLS